MFTRSVLLAKLKSFRRNEFVKVSSWSGFATVIKMLASLISIKVVSNIIGPSGIALVGQFINSIKTFYLLDEQMSEGLDLSKNSSDKATIVSELKSRNDLLRDKLATVKTSLPQTVEEVLDGYLAKISGVDFLEELQNVDEQTNILRAMLNININTK
ncbi:MAG: hypothetical protein EOO42_06560 [Flavobacteriales bacterium]|nr:MAG: hypothetical protein EOO42_06560 [Flavobacteriales bacterium]